MLERPSRPHIFRVHLSVEDRQALHFRQPTVALGLRSTSEKRGLMSIRGVASGVSSSMTFSLASCRASESSTMPTPMEYRILGYLVAKTPYSFRGEGGRALRMFVSISPVGHAMESSLAFFFFWGDRLRNLAIPGQGTENSINGPCVILRWLGACRGLKAALQRDGSRWTGKS